MSNLVPADQIELVVGAPRHEWKHLARAVSDEQTVYILHSHNCLDSGVDLRECEFSIALDRGINQRHWIEDTTVEVRVLCDKLVPWAIEGEYR